MSQTNERKLSRRESAIILKQKLMVYFEAVMASENPFTKLEQEMFHQIFSIGAVPFYIGLPGVAKTAIPRTIVEKLKSVGCDIYYHDLRLSHEDSTTVNGLVGRNEVNQTTIKYVPESYLEANKHEFALIAFEELNRSLIETMNAALQILNEREVGPFKLKQSVFMLATGNMGDKDGTVIEEITDAAVKGRLRFIDFRLTINDWYEGYAKHHVLPQIVGYINEHEGDFHNLAQILSKSDELGAYASPRSWSNLSDAIVMYYANSNPTQKQVADYVAKYGQQFIDSPTVTKLSAYLAKEVNLLTVLNSYDIVANQLKTSTSRPTISSIIFQVENDALDPKNSTYIGKWSIKQAENFEKFLMNNVDADQGESTAGLLFSHITKVLYKGQDVIKVFSSNNTETNKAHMIIVNAFKSFKIKAITMKNMV